MRSLTTLELFAGFLYLLLPFAYLEITQDPEITIRLLLISLFLVAFSVFKYLNRKTGLQTIESDLPVLIYAACLFLNLFSITKSINPGDAFFELGKTGSWLLILIILSNLLKKNPDHKIKLSLLITYSAFIFIAVGIFQFIRIPPHEKISKIDLEVVSFLSNKNFFAETLLLILPFTIFLLTSKNKTHRYIAVSAILLAIGFIIFIQSVTVFLGLFLALTVTGCMVFIFRKKLFIKRITSRQIVIISLLLLVMISTPFVLISFRKINTQSLTSKLSAAEFYIKNPAEIFNSETGRNDNSFYDRAFLLKNSIHIFKENPVTGAGLANWKILLPKYGLYGNEFMAVGRVRFEHPHNDYMFILCESGILGLICWLALFVTGIYFAFITFIRSEDRETKILMLCMLGNLFAFGTISLLSYPKERIFSMLLLITTFAVIIAFSKVKTKMIRLPAATFFVIVFIYGISFTYINLQRYKSEIKLYKAFHYQKREMFRLMQTSVETAISPFQTLDQTGTPLRWYLGQSFYYQNNPSKAFDNYLIASQQNPYHMQVLNDLGALYETKGDHENALKCFDRVFAINPNFAESKHNMVAVYFNSGETEKAYEYLRMQKAPYSSKWTSSMKTILFAKTETLVQGSQDSVLADLINQHLMKNQNFLMQKYLDAEKAGISFEEALLSLKSPK